MSSRQGRKIQTLKVRASAILSSQLKDLETDGIRFRGRNGHPQRSMNIAAIAVLSHLQSSQFHHYMLHLQRRRRQANHSINFDDYLMKGDYRLDRLDRKFASDFFVYEKGTRPVILAQCSANSSSDEA